MVTPTTMTMLFEGASGRTYNVSGYISDVVAARVLFNPNGVATTTSDNYWQPPEPCVLRKVSILTGPTVATGFFLTAGGPTVPNSAVLIGANLTTSTNAPALSIGFAANTLVGAVQF
jgi:hypothetical protein